MGVILYIQYIYSCQWGKRKFSKKICREGGPSRQELLLNYYVSVKYTASGSALISLIKRYSPAASRPTSSLGISTVS